MRKVFCCLAIIALMVAPSFAKIQQIGNLTADVPSGWNATQKGSVTVISHNSGKASVSVAVNSLGEASLTDIAERLYTQMGGEDLEQDSDGDYTFTFTDINGTAGLVILTDSGEGRYILMSVSGYGDAGVDDEIDEIIDSLDWDD
ncbi:MAG: hypothetical protein IJQ58_10785 [Synergistaceae bacterium]|nr:hypothetical protein [Synergistaceae bacterium]